MAVIFFKESELAIPLKRCTRCRELKGLECFVVRKSGKRKGHRLVYCKECNNKAAYAARKADPEAANAAARAAQARWRVENPEKARAQWARAREKRLERNPNYWRDVYWKYRPRKLVSMRARYARRRLKQGEHLLQTIHAAIPTRFYGDLREEIAQTLALAVLSNEISHSELRNAASQIAKQIQQTSFSNRFKFKSLDAPVSAENSTPLAEYLVG